MIQYCLVFLLSFFLVFHSNSTSCSNLCTTSLLSNKAMVNLNISLQSEDYIGDMDSFDRDSGTRIINNQYQTGHKNNPGTYDKDFDLESQMTISDINAGFDLDYGVTVNSHSVMQD